MTYASFSASMPAGSWMVPLESERVTTLPPSWLSFLDGVLGDVAGAGDGAGLALEDSPRVLSISSAK
jgi:hypothetical protein